MMNKERDTERAMLLKERLRIQQKEYNSEKKRKKKKTKSKKDR